MRIFLLPSIALFLVHVAAEHGITQEFDVWIGTEGKHGVYHLRLNSGKGLLSDPKKITKEHGAGFLAVDSEGKNLYVTSRSDNKGGIISYSLTRQESGEYEIRNTGISYIPNGHHPTHISLDRTERFVFSAQYGGGSVAVFKIDEDGAIGSLTSDINHKGGSRVFKNRQNSPHPHWIGVDTTNSFVAVPDLGLDQVVMYKLDALDGSLTAIIPWSLPPGSGPRHMKFHENGKFAYVLNEFTMTVSVFNLDSTNEAVKIQEIKSLPDELRDERLNTCAEVRIHPNGKYLYTSNRGHDSITVFEIDSSSGRIKFLERESIRGSWPRNFSLSPDGKWLIAAGKFSNTLSLFEVKPNGLLEFTRTVKNVPQPICVAFSQATTSPDQPEKP